MGTVQGRRLEWGLKRFPRWIFSDQCSWSFRGHGSSGAIFSRVDARTDKILSKSQVEMAYGCFRDGGSLAYGPVNATKRKDLWMELAGVAATFQGSLMLIGGGFNVTVEARDRPNDMRGQDSDLEEFWAFIAEEALIEMTPVACVYTWRSMTGWNIKSRLDGFLC